MHSTWPVRRTGPVIAIVPPAAAAGHDWTGYIVAYSPSADEHPAVQALAIYDGMHRGLFRAEELQPVSSDDAPPATDEEAVTYLTGNAPAGLHYDCPRDGCSFAISVTGAVDPDEDYDEFEDEVSEHRRSHEGRARDGWDDVAAIPLWLAIRDHAPEPFDVFGELAKKVTPDEVARALRAAANIMDGGQ